MITRLKRSRVLPVFGVSAVCLSAYTLESSKWSFDNNGLVRFTRAMVTISKIVVDYKSFNRSTKFKHSTKEYLRAKSELHTQSALRLRELCCKNGGCFIKVGQHIGALDYLLPFEYVSVMRKLHSDAPKSPLKQIHQVIREDLGKDVSEVFQSFDDEPIGAASLAQVHKATLKDGTPVAVKVQHLNVKDTADTDMQAMQILFNFVAWAFPDFQFFWLAEETKRNLPKELDFVHEAKNCELAQKMFMKFSYLKVPKVYWDFTTNRILTMEYCEGGQINDVSYIEKNNISPVKVSQYLGRLYSEMIFVQGFIHCDPHPGNILVNKSHDGQTQLTLLDHGLYQTLSESFRINYCKLWSSLIHTDLTGVKKYGRRLGTDDLYPLFACMVTGRSWDSISTGINTQRLSNDEEELVKSQAGDLLPQISAVLNRVPREMLLIFKTNDLLRGVEHTLGTRKLASHPALLTMSRCCTRALYQNKRTKHLNKSTSHLRRTLVSVKFYCLENYKLVQLKIYEWFLTTNLLFSSLVGSFKLKFIH